MVNQEHVREWTDALRSPNAPPQVTSKLAAEDEQGVVGYCCLGVGCVVAHIEHERVVTEADEEDEDEHVDHYFEDASDLPPRRFHEWLGITEPETSSGDVDIDWPEGWHGPTFDEWNQWSEEAGRPDNIQQQSQMRENNRFDGRVYRNYLSCSALNDEAGLTFAQIADVIDYFGVR